MTAGAAVQPALTSATQTQAALLGIGGDPSATSAAYKAWQQSTGYQQQLQQGQNSVTAALGAKGLLDSGAGEKALLNYGQQAADSNFQTYLGDVQGYTGALQDQQRTGLSAASALAGVGQSYANTVSANNNAAADAKSNAALSTGNAVQSALGSLVSTYGVSQRLNSSYTPAALRNPYSADVGQFASQTPAALLGGSWI